MRTWRHTSWHFVRCLAIVLTALVVVATAEAATDGTVTIGLHVTLAAKWFDPKDTETLTIPFMVLYAVHDALVKPMPGNDLTPSLAESWTVSKDHLTYEFTLRKGARFHNGDPVTAEDVRFSWDRYKGAAAKLLKDRVREVQVVDPAHVRFTLKEPWPDFLTFYGTTASGAGWIVPKKYMEKVGEEAFLTAPIGAGPYRVVSFQPGVQLTLEAFEGYWRKVPRVKRLVMRSMPEEITRATALKKGEVDIAYLLTGPVARDIERTPGLRLAHVVVNGPWWLELPDEWDPKSPWHDRRVREAASLAIDRQAINEAETLGLSRLTGSIIPRNFDFSLPIDPPKPDPQRAKKLLAEAGYANGFDAGDLTPYPPYWSKAEAVIGMLQAVGIRTRMRTMERATFLTGWRQKSLKGVILATAGAAGNAATRIEPYVVTGGIYTNGSVPEIDELFKQQAKELDRNRRKALLYQIQRIMHDQLLHVAIDEPAFIWGVGSRVEETTADSIKGYPYAAPYEDLRLKK